MPPKATFDEILDAVEHLPVDEQAQLLDVVSRRLAEQGRQRVVEDVRDAQAEFKDRGAQGITVDELMREIDS